MKISRQMRIVLAALGLLVVVGFAGKMLLSKSAPAATVVPPAVHPHPVRQVHPHPVRHVVARTRVSHHTAPRVHVDPTHPAALRLALQHHVVVVAVLYARHARGEDAAVQAARAGARGAHVGFAALDVSNEAVATSIALKLPGSSDPSVVVVKRPGDITLLLNGYVDSEVIAQAARDAGA
jgi:hypothetical protein